MDINTLRITVTVVSLVLFLLLVAHCWSRRRTQEYHDAALLPFIDEPIDEPIHEPIDKPTGAPAPARHHAKGAQP
jgi:cbb3-type cytochrome oxidase subunit 3